MHQELQESLKFPEFPLKFRSINSISSIRMTIISKGTNKYQLEFRAPGDIRSIAGPNADVRETYPDNGGLILCPMTIKEYQSGLKFISKTKNANNLEILSRLTNSRP